MAAMRLLFVCLYLYCIYFVFVFQLSYVMYPLKKVFTRGTFSNFGNCKIKMDGLLFPTSEHVSQ